MRHMLLLTFIVLAAGCIGDGSGSQTEGEHYEASSAENETLFVENETHVEPSNGFKEFFGKDLPECTGVPFIVSPMATDDYELIIPLGNLNPTGGHVFPTDHIYMHTEYSGSSSKRAPLVSPGTIHINTISSSEWGDVKDYSMDFDVCDGVSGKFGHVSSLSPRLTEALGSGGRCEEYSTGGYEYRNCWKNVDLVLEPGESVGTVGGIVGGSSALDIWLYDERTEEGLYTNPDRWEERQFHVVCPIDYFTPEIKSEMYSNVKDFSGKLRTAEPICGTIYHDKPGRAQGVWFLKGTRDTYPEDPHMALVPDNLDPTKQVVSMGTSTNMNPGSYKFTPTESGTRNRDFADVKADSSIYCYDTEDRSGNSEAMIMQMTSPTTLKMEGVGSCSSKFSKDATEFER